jgi:hypothetical protein
MSIRKAALAAAMSLSLAHFASFGCASGAPPNADKAPPGQAVDDFDQYECPNCIGAGESTFDEDETQ